MKAACGRLFCAVLEIDNAMKSAYFVTGTDTGVGKTLVSCALLRVFAARGLRAVGMKPVAAGCEALAGGMRCDDVERLRAAGNVETPAEWINPYAFLPPVAPHLAAAQSGEEIRIAGIAAAFGRLSALADVVIVEGVGGWRVPLNPREDTADLAHRLGLPVILVVGMRLGCLNHALLTAQSIAASGLPLAGWVANRIDPAMPLFDENVQALRERLPAPLLGVLPYQMSADDGGMAEYLRIDGLN
jgi:dethiobiotin synthetase